ncbi:phosphate acyltransferase PlsX [Candidatus Acetothermia bacterium]|nr:MAG: phosphate acyltransferase PlsX [Candidatus Acetothermia bacterium]
MRILVDVMSGDLPPEELVRGGVTAGREAGIEIGFVGTPDVIRTALSQVHEREGGRFFIVPASQVIRMDDPPVRAVREKRDSSLIKGLTSLKHGEGDAFVTPGNTGAAVAGAIFTLGRIHGVPRPGIAATLPTLSDREILIIDVGATVDCAPPHLLHFGLMGGSYARDVMGISTPRIGLLNIGVEKTKGNKLTQRTFSLLEGSPLPFVGNVEGHDLLTDPGVDVVVCDGFVGNVFLKALEGGINAVTSFLRNGIRSGGPREKLGGLLLQPVFAALRERLSYERHGGAPLLGVNGVVVIGHGRSDAAAIAGAINAARRAVAARLNERIAQGMKGWGNIGS